MAERKIYWMKLRDDFFASKRIKKLRNMAGGDTYCIIYLKLQLLAMKNEGVIHWTGLEDNVADELALDLDEKPDDVSVTLMYLLQTGLAETSDNIDFFFPYAVENTGSETTAAERKRLSRERQRNSVLQICDNVTQVSQTCHTEIDIDIEKDKEKEIEKESEYGGPTLEDVKAFCRERNSPVDPLRFWSYYNASGWLDNKGEPIRSWKQKLISWEATEPEKKPAAKNVKASCRKYPVVSVDEMRKKVDMI